MKIFGGDQQRVHADIAPSVFHLSFITQITLELINDRFLDNTSFKCLQNEA